MGMVERCRVVVDAGYGSGAVALAMGDVDASRIPMG